MQLRIFRNDDSANRRLNLLAFPFKILPAHPRTQQQKLVAAKANQDIDRGDFRADRRGNIPQNGVPCRMTERVIDTLKIVHVNHRDTFHAFQMGSVGFKIPSGIHPGQRIHKQLDILSPAPFKQKPRAVRVNPASFIQLRQHFQYAGRSVQAQILGEDKVHVRAGEFQLIERGFLLKGARGNTVCAAAVVIPERRTVLLGFAKHALLIQLQNGVRDGVHQPNDVEKRFQPADDGHRHRGIVAVILCRKHDGLPVRNLRIDHLPDYADVMLRLSVGPKRAQSQIIPAILIPVRQKEADGKLRIFLCRRLQSLFHPLKIRITQAGKAIRLREVDFPSSVLRGFAPIRDIRQLGRHVVFKLQPAAARGEEIHPLLHGFQKTLYAVVARHIGMRKDFVRKAVSFKTIRIPALEGRRHPKVRGDIQQALQQQRIERAAFSPQNSGDCRIVVNGFLILSVGRQRVVNIRQSHDLRGNRNLLPAQTIRISVSVPAFMMPAANLQRIAEQRLILSERHLLQNFRSGCGMGFEYGELFLRQLSGCIQNAVRKADFSDIANG